jgi:hypothetical protein
VSFKTGPAINVFHLKQDSAAERGKSMIGQFEAIQHAKTWAQDVRPFKGSGCLPKNGDAAGTSAVHALTVANPESNPMCRFLVESPESDRETAWKVGQ